MRRKLRKLLRLYKMNKISHEQLVNKALNKPSVKVAYDALEEEFALLEETIKVRFKDGKTQEKAAKITSPSTPPLNYI